MSENPANGNGNPDKDKAQPRIQLPGFVEDEDIGLGDVLKLVTEAFGIKPCGGCEQRAARLNRWIGFSGKRSK